MIEDRSSKGDTEANRRRNLADDRESRAAALPDIRDRSRQEYLKLREQQRLELLRQEIQDEAFLFSDQKLSKKEIAQHEYKKEVLRLAEARMKIDTKEDGYVMPEGKKDD
jgi:pre-mRNA-splicing factor ATP-dependent RNA helicase DHX16